MRVEHLNHREIKLIDEYIDNLKGPRIQSITAVVGTYLSKPIVL